MVAHWRICDKALGIVEDAGLSIRIYFNPDPDPAFKLNPDPGPQQNLEDELFTICILSQKY
jgi:hypothetical protein